MTVNSWKGLSGHFSERRFRARYDIIRTAKQWYEQLFLRIRVESLIAELHRDLEADPELLEPDPELIDTLAAALVQLLADPVLDSTNSPFDSVYFLDGAHDLLSTVAKPFSHGIRRMTLHELFQIERTLRPAWSQHAQQSFRAPFPQSLAWKRPRGLDEPVAPLDEFRVFLTVDPTLPVKLLQQQLDDLLTSLKVESEVTADLSRFHKPDLENWGKTDLLPCIDLHLAAAAIKIEIPKGGVTDVISGGQKSNSRITQTLIPLTKDLLSQTPHGRTLIRRLAHMAMDEGR
jgi:hypothetical protein